jgi:hypothetical protein
MVLIKETSSDVPPLRRPTVTQSVPCDETTSAPPDCTDKRPTRLKEIAYAVTVFLVGILLFATAV